MSTHNIGFYEDLTKIIFELSSNIIKYTPYFFCCLSVLLEVSNLTKVILLKKEEKWVLGVCMVRFQVDQNTHNIPFCECVKMNWKSIMHDSSIFLQGKRARAKFVLKNVCILRIKVKVLVLGGCSSINKWRVS